MSPPGDGAIEPIQVANASTHTRKGASRWLWWAVAGALLGLLAERFITSHAGGGSPEHYAVRVKVLDITLYKGLGPESEMRPVGLRWYWGTALAGMTAGAAIGLTLGRVVRRCRGKSSGSV